MEWISLYAHQPLKLHDAKRRKDWILVVNVSTLVPSDIAADALQAYPLSLCDVTHEQDARHHALRCNKKAGYHIEAMQRPSLHRMEIAERDD